MNILFNLQPYTSPSRAHYQHAALVIAEGLEKLGYTFYGNIDFWYNREKEEYTIKKAPADFEPDVNLFSCWYVIRNEETFLDKVNFNKINVLLDAQDGWDTPVISKEFEDFDLILKCHYSKPFRSFKYKMPWAKEFYASYPEKTVPWNFGLSNRIIDAIDKYRDCEVKDQVLINFRMPYAVRAMSVEIIPPLIDHKFKIHNNITDSMDELETDDDLSYWAQSGRRHNEIYFKDINEAKFTFAFCGKLIDFPISGSFGSRLKRFYQRLMVKISDLLDLAPKDNAYQLILNYGGWRLFESFISNTVPLQMDFEYWGMDWPELPKNGEHYISVKGLRFKDAAKRILDMSEGERQRISKNGREWCLTHYSPKPVAERFLKHIAEIPKKK
jgi:hypothetical protein